MISVVKFLPNRVQRLYHGGSGIDRLRGLAEPVDSRYPEDWIASCIDGNGREFHSIGHGISKALVDGAQWDFPALLHSHGEELLGAEHLQRYGETPAVLTKFLDAAERLPLQVHPTRADAAKYFNSSFGKTEAWIVLATRVINGEEPYLLVGFNEQLDRERFVQESLAGEYCEGLGMLHKLLVKPGDVVVIYGGLPHAIGSGVTMVEVMEPSDLVIVPERNCCGRILDDAKRYAGLDGATAMSLFDYTAYSAAALRQRCCPRPALVATQGASTLRTLIPRASCGYFAAQELTLAGSWQLDLASERCFRIGIVVDGCVTMGGESFMPGESFMIPYAATTGDLSGSGRLLFILPPDCH